MHFYLFFLSLTDTELNINLDFSIGVNLTLYLKKNCKHDTTFPLKLKKRIKLRTVHLLPFPHVYLRFA